MPVRHCTCVHVVLHVCSVFSIVQNALDKIKSQEAKLEVERAALQDARFSNDMSQLRLKELEGSLEEERATSKQLAGDVGGLKQTVASLKSSLEDEEKRTTLLREQLQRYADIVVHVYVECV